MKRQRAGGHPIHLYIIMLSPNSAENRRTAFPSSVALKPLKHSVRSTSSGGTGPTWALDTSPLSASDSPIEAARIEHSNRKKIQTKHRVVYNDSHHERPKPIVTSLNGKKSNEEISSYSFHQPRMKSSRYPSSSTPTHKNKTKKHDETLTWRMDPSLSLSDFTLTIIGINDNDAVKKYIASKKKRQEKKQSRRDGTWMEDKLYLDISEDESNTNDDCYNSANDSEDHNEHRSDTHVQSSPCIYPVVEKYFLHKTTLAIGSRRCGYFARLFQKKKISSCNSHSIEVPVSCLPAIPKMLDYIYNTDLNTHVHATTATAIPLRYLASLLGNRPLFDSATHFLQTDLRPETTVEYLKHAVSAFYSYTCDICSVWSS